MNSCFTKRVVRAFDLFNEKDTAFNRWKWYIELMVTVKEVFRTADSLTSVEDHRLLKLEKLEEHVREWIKKQGEKEACWNSLGGGNCWAFGFEQ
jgi:hypothetical protein